MANHKPFDPPSKQHHCIRRGYQATKHTKWYRKPEWCSTQSHSPRNTEQSDRRTSTTFATYWPSSTRFQWPENLKALQWPLYCSFEVEGVAIFVDNSQGEQLIQPSVVAFFRVWIVYNAVATFSQLPAVLLLTNQIRISITARQAVQNVKSALDWSIAMQFAQIYTVVYSLTIHTLNTYMNSTKLSWCTE